MEFERASCNDFWIDTMSHPENGYFGNELYWVGKVFPKGWSYRNITLINQSYDDFTRVCGNETNITSAEKMIKHFNTKRTNTSLDNIRYPLANLAIPNIGHIFNHVIYHANTMRQMKLACELEIHRLEHGSYPENIDNIATDQNYTKDICDGKTMRYLTTPNGYKLWSVGKNLIDENAKTDPVEGFSHRQPDWVWEIDL